MRERWWREDCGGTMIKGRWWRKEVDSEVQILLCVISELRSPRYLLIGGIRDVHVGSRGCTSSRVPFPLLFTFISNFQFAFIHGKCREGFRLRVELLPNLLRVHRFCWRAPWSSRSNLCQKLWSCNNTEEIRRGGSVSCQQVQNWWILRLRLRHQETDFFMGTIN